jgi:hypothetical protein
MWKKHLWQRRSRLVRSAAVAAPDAASSLARVFVVQLRPGRGVWLVVFLAAERGDVARARGRRGAKARRTGALVSPPDGGASRGTACHRAACRHAQARSDRRPPAGQTRKPPRGGFRRFVLRLDQAIDTTGRALR